MSSKSSASASSAAKYRGRFFRLTDDGLRFQVGGVSGETLLVSQYIAGRDSQGSTMPVAMLERGLACGAIVEESVTEVIQG